MKKFFITVIAMFGVMLFAGCTGEETKQPDDSAATGNTTEETDVTKPDTPTGPVAFADVGMGLMDAADTYKLFTFEEGEGTCLEQGFPINLVYSSDNVVKTEDESYVEDMTMIDFMGNLRFDEVPLTGGPTSCVIKATRGVTTVTLSCSTGEGEEETEVCTGKFKMYAHM